MKLILFQATLQFAMGTWQEPLEKTNLPTWIVYWTGGYQHLLMLLQKRFVLLSSSCRYVPVMSNGITKQEYRAPKNEIFLSSRHLFHNSVSSKTTYGNPLSFGG